MGGRLLRGDNLQELSAADVARLVGDIGLTTVVDLRSTAELTAEGPAPLQAVDGVRHVHLPVLPEQGSATDMVADVLLTRADTDRSRYPADPVTGHYLGYLEDRPDQVVAAVRTIASSEGPVLVHCAAGKDRTGVVVALALSAVGVRPEAIVADYAATGERTGALLERLRRSPTYAGDINSKPQAEHAPRPGTMTAFLDAGRRPVWRDRPLAGRSRLRRRRPRPAARQAAVSLTGRAAGARGVGRHAGSRASFSAILS